MDGQEEERPALLDHSPLGADGQTDGRGVFPVLRALSGGPAAPGKRPGTGLVAQLLVPEDAVGCVGPPDSTACQCGPSLGPACARSAEELLDVGRAVPLSRARAGVRSRGSPGGDSGAAPAGPQQPRAPAFPASATFRTKADSPGDSRARAGPHPRPGQPCRASPAAWLHLSTHRNTRPPGPWRVACAVCSWPRLWSVVWNCRRHLLALSTPTAL